MILQSLQTWTRWNNVLHTKLPIPESDRLEEQYKEEDWNPKFGMLNPIHQVHWEKEQAICLGWYRRGLGRLSPNDGQLEGFDPDNWLYEQWGTC